MQIKKNLTEILENLPENVQLCAVSKTKPENELLEAYDAGQRIFGENKIQELAQKYKNLPNDIQWHFIGHLQRNKVKFIVPFVSLIHGCDSVRLIEKIEVEGAKIKREIPVLLQIFIAQEETKFGFDVDELEDFLSSKIFLNLKFVKICGLMGMATNTSDEKQVESEFEELSLLFAKLQKEYFKEKKYFKEISMGMSNDYKIAVRAGSTLVRVGSAIFGHRNY